MTLPSWPSTLPPLVSPIGSAKSDELVPAAKESEFDDGPSRVRRRMLQTSVTRPMSLKMTRGQFSSFYAFLRNDLNAGARRFTAPVRLSSGKLGVRTCRITGKVSDEDLGRVSIVSFNVVIWGW